jgi:hypothetical protein
MLTEEPAPERATVRPINPVPVSERTTMKVVSGSSVVETVGGLGAIVLAILGLIGLWPGYMMAISVLALGGALLASGGAVAGRFSRLHRTLSTEWENVDLGGGMTGEVLGGAAAVVLGILALLGVFPLLLSAIAIIVLGAAVLAGSGTTYVVSYLAGAPADLRTARVTREATSAAAGIQVLFGIGAAVLGILALVGMMPLLLILIALIALGTSVMVGGAAMSGRMTHFVPR